MGIWDASICCGPHVGRKLISWIPPQEGVLKFSVDRAARGKSGLDSIGNVLRNDKGDVMMVCLLVFTKIRLLWKVILQMQLLGF